MEIPFAFGTSALPDHFMNRQKEVQLLKNNFENLVNTVIVSPHGWGKASLVRHVSEIIKSERKNKISVCILDVCHCRTRAQFYAAYANAILKSATSTREGFMAAVKKYLSKYLPKVSFSEGAPTNDLSFDLDLNEAKFSLDELLDLPQQIAHDTWKKIVVCIGTFQRIGEYGDSVTFQRKLRAHWQLHDKVCYCLYGSKRPVLLNFFNSDDMPFYRSNDTLFLQKIAREHWVKCISERFIATGKRISDALSGDIADAMYNHPYYVKLYSQQVWLRTQPECTKTILDKALDGLMDYMHLLFTTIVDGLTVRQIAFLMAIVAGETNFSSKEVLQKYDLGTSANIKNLKNALLDKELIDILPDKKIELQDPVFSLWLKKTYMA